MRPAPQITLNNGVEMPIFGLGTWKMSDGTQCYEAVRRALDIGYRLIDTATLYGNERSVGKAVRESGVPREEIFVTTKLWPTDFFSPEKAFEASFERLAIEYVDLYLVHWPIPLIPHSVWFAMEKLYESKRVRAIGVSNYHIGDIEKLLEYAHVVPAVNQVKFSPFDYEEEVLKCCRSHCIRLEAYSPLTRGAHLDDAVVAAIAKKHRKTPAQIMIRWCIEHEVAVIPKSSSPRHLAENAEVFDFSLDGEDMQTLNALS
ncbi:MAG: hypothetical protein RLZZ416_241 [Candidatus Parcubacteria bacterium]|jgi:diketogulonate reductase-like aldo/keto reductase